MHTKKLIVIGAAGYVGLVTAVSLAEMGNQVIGIDKDAEKIEMLKKGIPTIHEAGLDMMLKKTLGNNMISFVSAVNVLWDAEIIIIAVGTPMDEIGRTNLSYIEQAAEEIGKFAFKSGVIVAIKSTVPVGTAEKVRAIIKKEIKERNLIDFKFSVVSNPEFLAEGRAVKDAMEPARIIIGTEDEYAKNAMYLLYRPFFRTNDRFMVMTNKEAELVKYTCNYTLALRLSGINAIASLCEVVGADVEVIRKAVGSDPRIGPHFLFPGPGYGGSCFPKDVTSLVFQARDNGLSPEVVKMLEAPEILNGYQQLVVAKKVISHFGQDLNGKQFAVWGLSFKAGTDDIRESSAITTIEFLLLHGAKIIAYDSLAMDVARLRFSEEQNLEFVLDMYSALPEADALIIMNEDRAFRSPDFERIKGLLKTPCVFDARNLYDLEEIRQHGFRYTGIGRGES